MMASGQYESRVLSLFENLEQFDDLALEIFRHQAKFNALYADFLRILGVDVHRINTPAEIPFMPIAVFKNHDIKTGSWKSETVFKSSGTTGTQSSHHVKSLDWYHLVARKCFEQHFGPVSQYVFAGLLPSYLERKDASLVSMVHAFMQYVHQEPLFFLKDFEGLAQAIHQLSRDVEKIMLFGVTFALMDLAQGYSFADRNIDVVLTGGMKSYGRELLYEEVHEKLKNAFGEEKIKGEYGMTEMLSQAYAHSYNIYHMSASMRAVPLSLSDPLSVTGFGRQCRIGIIDLANIHTCSFIATDDLGVVYDNRSFAINGRIDNSDIRGCTLMY